MNPPKTDAETDAERLSVVRFFANPATVAEYAKAMGVSRTKARNLALDWLDGVNLFEAGKVFQGNRSGRGRPSNLYCSDATRAAESSQRPVAVRPPAPAPIGHFLEFFREPRTVEEFAAAKRMPLGAAQSCVEAEFEIPPQTLFFAGECTLEGISKKGTFYPRSISPLYCSDRWIALTSALQWAAKLWRDAGCPED